MQLSSFTAKGYQFKNYTDCTEEENKQILRWRNDEAIRKWMTNDKLIAAEEHSLFVKRLKNDEERAYFAVFCQDQYIASIYLTDIKDERGERGIYVVPDYQGKGVTQHIEIAFLKYIRLKGIRQVIAKVKSDNEKSVRYHIKMGYKEQSRDNEYIHYILDTEMITNVNRGGYELNGFKFRDYTTLTLEEKKMVLIWRNDESIRKWMYSQEIISLDNHLKFIDGLADREDKYYWLVFSPQGEPTGCFYIVDVDREGDVAEFGLYMRPDSKVFGFDFVKTCYEFYFNTLDFRNIYCAVDYRNIDALSMDMFMGCIFTEEKWENGIKYLVSTNLNQKLFQENTKIKFSDYLKYCRTLKK